jgi:hypothetical protein
LPKALVITTPRAANAPLIPPIPSIVFPITSIKPPKKSVNLIKNLSFKILS